MITRAREHLLADGMPARETLVSALREHRGAAARMAGLRDAYEAKSDILSRRRRDGLLRHVRTRHGKHAVGDVAVEHLAVRACLVVIHYTIFLLLLFHFFLSLIFPVTLLLNT